MGAKQSSEKFIQKVIEEVKADPFAKAIYMGDAGECVTKNSKGNIYEQLLSPGDQLRVAAELLGELKDKLLFGIRGNHGNRVDRETGVGWDEMLCARVGMPYMGVSCLGDIMLRLSRSVTVPFSVYVHHGSAGAITPGGKTTAGQRPKSLANADIALTAHTHACGESVPPQHLAYTDPIAQRICWKTMRMFMCGSAYDSRSGYAEEKQYSVILPQHLSIGVRAVKAKDGPAKEIAWRTIDGFADEYLGDEEKAKWILPRAA